MTFLKYVSFDTSAKDGNYMAVMDEYDAELADELSNFVASEYGSDGELHGNDLSPAAPPPLPPRPVAYTSCQVNMHTIPSKVDLHRRNRGLAQPPQSQTPQSDITRLAFGHDTESLTGPVLNTGFITTTYSDHDQVNLLNGWTNQFYGHKNPVTKEDMDLLGYGRRLKSPVFIKIDQD